MVRGIANPVLVQRRTELKTQFATHVKHSLESSLRQLIPEGENGVRQSTDGNNQVLNEEGLPFVDPLEMLPDSPPQTPQISADQSTAPTGNILGRTPGQVVPFQPESHPGQSRKAWMDSVLATLEQEEAEELANEHQEASQPNVPQPSGSKETAEPNRMKAFQRGFLQRQAAKQAQLEPEGSTRPKKQVRIAAPEPDSDEESEQENAKEKRSKSVHYGRHPDDVGVEEEAARIVDMLGPQVIEGHPNAERILADLRAEQNRMVQVTRASSPKETEEEPSEPAKPAVGASIVERDADQAESSRPTGQARAAPRKKLSAFKQRQLERQGQASVPEAPTVSQGVSAIERAGRADESLAESRVRQGLPPQVPHARPTKAYAERLAKRNQRGQHADEAERADEGTDAPPTHEDGSRRVRFGPPTVVEPDGMDEDDNDVHEPQEVEASDVDMADEENPTEHPYEQASQGMYSDEEGMESEGEDGLWDSDDEYTAEDLEALKPSMDEHPNDAVWNEQLAREYAEAKARLALPVSRRVDAADEDPAEAYGVAPLDASLAQNDETRTTSHRARPKVSQFKAARMAGEPIPNPHDDLAARQDRAGHELAHQLEGHDVPPVMVLPNLAPVRYPRPTDDPHAIDLDGESDEDDSRLQELMRARLALDMESSAEVPRPRRAEQPPVVGSRKKAT